jgi:uncharacterized protein (TIGR03067 family)
MVRLCRKERSGTMALHSLLIVAVGLLPAADDTKENVVKKEMAKFQGTWKFVSMEIEGKKKSDEEITRFTLMIQGDDWTVERKTVSDKGTATSRAPSTFKLDPTQKPQAIDFTLPNGKVLRGIYSLDSKKMTVCFGGKEKDGRPSAFKTRPDSRLVLFVLTKETEP